MNIKVCTNIVKVTTGVIVGATVMYLVMLYALLETACGVIR